MSPEQPPRFVAAARVTRKTRWWGPFKSTWTTIGRTIYAPVDCYDPLDDHASIQHEMVHVKQWNQHGLWFWMSYLFLPVPIFFAWFRWRWEREAYLVDLKAGSTPEQIVDALASGTYLWPWPKRWMLRWFKEQH